MSVIVEFDYKKCTVKTTPATSIKAIIQSACEQLNLSPPEAYALQSKKQILEPYLSFRMSGLQPGIKLALAYKGISTSKQLVTIALQTEESGRLIDTFDSSTTLWEMLLHFEVKGDLNLTKRSDVPPKKSILQFSNNPVYVMPICVFSNKEYSSIATLKSTTIRDLGLESGSAAIRLLSKFTGHPLGHFLAEINREPERGNEQKAVEIPIAIVAPVRNDLSSVGPIEIIATPSVSIAVEAAPIKINEQEVLTESVETPALIERDVILFKPAPEGTNAINSTLSVNHSPIAAFFLCLISY